MTAQDSAGAKFARNAFVWFIPALIALPFYLILLGISLVGGDGALLEITEGVRGGLNCALGPLLILCGVVVVGLTVHFGTDTEHYLEGGFFALICVGFGTYLAYKAFHALG